MMNTRFHIADYYNYNMSSYYMGALAFHIHLSLERS